ncbi:cyclic nucleotide-binding domain-containing protein [Nocardioides sp. AE5]|uniref:cyclic nucleotide-binding domain-containing protein n=1 Tax=Nocardioides sp. AE5 TaxID=2962573 RepID=UPI0028810CC9|nr:cyclic nucleotide-binding domain-containing protein [Nocardioides sp. AE5]MDT0200878.1 cyclic nucleotide-binding domain-containing protein [Nocardioides sp. AE5]
MNDDAIQRRKLAAIDRFSNLTDAEVQSIVDRGTPVRIPANWSLIWEKTPADKAYIIIEGEVSVRRNGEEIARLGPGDTVGETAIVTHKLRNASVVSLTELQVLHFTSEAVQELLGIETFRTALEQTSQDRLAKPAPPA